LTISHLLIASALASSQTAVADATAPVVTQDKPQPENGAAPTPPPALPMPAMSASSVVTPPPAFATDPAEAVAKPVAPAAAAAPAAAEAGKAAQPMSVQADDEGAIVVTGRGKPPPGDPLQNINVQSFEVVQSVDRAVVGPITHTYMEKVPNPIRQGIHNVLTNLEEPTAIVNFTLQHKFGRALKTLFRLAINTTVGLGGLIDVAKSKPFRIKHTRNGFAHTMGFYGIKSGPYLYLPLIGSTTLRDVIGRMMDLAVLPTIVGKPFKGFAFTTTRGVLASIDDRAELDEVLKQLRDNNPDPYGALK